MLLGAAAGGAEEFPLMGWGPPPASETAYRTYREAHLNTVQIPATDAHAQAIRLAADTGLRVLLTDLERSGPDPEAWVEFAAAFDHIAGWLLEDGLAPERAADVAARLDALLRLNPRGVAFAALAPPNGDRNAWNAAAQALLATGMPVLCFHLPVLADDGSTDEGRLYGALEAARERGGAALWGMIPVTAREGGRFASESDLRLLVYSHLAYGARGLCYDRYWRHAPEKKSDDPFAGWGSAIVEPGTGKPSYLWENMAKVNREVLALAPALLGLRAEKARFVGDVPPGAAALDGRDAPLRAVVAQRALIGFFRDEADRPWLMVVNRRHGGRLSAESTRSTVQLLFDGSVQRALRVNEETGAEEDLPLEGRGVFVGLPGGTGCLLRLETAPR